MNTDIVTLLRKYEPYNKLHGQAADEIERLRADRDHWKKVAERLAERLAGDSWLDPWVIIERAGGTRG